MQRPASPRCGHPSLSCGSPTSHDTTQRSLSDWSAPRSPPAKATPPRGGWRGGEAAGPDRRRRRAHARVSAPKRMSRCLTKANEQRTSPCPAAFTSQSDSGVPSPTEPEVNAANMEGTSAPAERLGILARWRSRKRHSNHSHGSFPKPLHRPTRNSSRSPKTSPRFAKTW
jgi:hypothetical protein